jgi:hypothetical protein
MGEITAIWIYPPDQNFHHYPHWGEDRAAEKCAAEGPPKILPIALAFLSFCLS